MYKDIINYELSDAVTESDLLKVAQRIYNDWMCKQEGFMGWEINKHVTGKGYTDIVYWKSEDYAKQSQSNMASIINPEEWYGCYNQESIKTTSLSLLKRFS